MLAEDLAAVETEAVASLVVVVVAFLEVQETTRLVPADSVSITGALTTFLKR